MGFSEVERGHPAAIRAWLRVRGRTRRMKLRSRFEGEVGEAGAEIDSEERDE